MNGDELHPIYDVSRYPRHVPTAREQAKDKPWDLEEQIQSKRDLERMTAIGEISNPLTYRSWLEDEYDGLNPLERTQAHLESERGADAMDFDGVNDYVDMTDALESIDCVGCGQTIRGGSVAWSVANEADRLYVLHSPRCTHHREASGTVVTAGESVGDAVKAYLSSMQTHYDDVRAYASMLDDDQIEKLTSHAAEA